MAPSARAWPITAKVSETYFDAVRGKAPQYRSWVQPVYKR